MTREPLQLGAWRFRLLLAFVLGLVLPGHAIVITRLAAIICSI